MGIIYRKRISGSSEYGNVGDPSGGGRSIQGVMVLGIDQAALYNVTNSRSRIDGLCAGDGDWRGGGNAGGAAGRVKDQEDDPGGQRRSNQQ